MMLSELSLRQQPRSLKRSLPSLAEGLALGETDKSFVFD